MCQQSADLLTSAGEAVEGQALWFLVTDRIFNVVSLWVLEKEIVRKRNV